jgi:DNA ligase-1
VRRFAALYAAIDQTTRTSEKVAALRDYFREAPPRDAAWALWVLTGRKVARGMTTRKLTRWCIEATGLPAWMLDECREAVGDNSETLALLVAERFGEREEGCHWPLHELIETRVRPLRDLPEPDQMRIVVDTWAHCSSDERFLFHKLIGGAFRVGAARKLVVQGLAQAFDLERAVVEHRLMGSWMPTEDDYARLTSADGGGDDPGRPYPFYLASQLDGPPHALGDPADWQVEWKWDGIRAQLIRRNAQVLVWSRGEELVTEAFPELRNLAQSLPDGTVLDGEVLGYENERPLPFIALQKRLNRKRVELTLFPEVPVAYVAYDVLEWAGVDQRARPLRQRRALLESICRDDRCSDPALVLSPLVEAASWDERVTLRSQARARGVEGLMLKRGDSPYGVGRTRGAWWKWKIDPFTADCVLIYAQRGTGKRAGVYSDYTFGVWSAPPESSHAGALDTSHPGIASPTSQISGGGGGASELVPVAKAYSGLTDEEIDRVDRFVRQNTLERRGPLRLVRPELVFELHFEGIRVSDRHRSGIALRFPRMARWRTDKKPADADTLDHLRRLLPRDAGGG